ncbi:Serine decarboxylase [Diplonema papillatum]|nr:Serine decarboxylase [Diplonema papillatum]
MDQQSKRPLGNGTDTAPPAKKPHAEEGAPEADVVRLNLRGAARARFDAFVAKIREGATGTAWAAAAALPEEDKKLLLPLFKYHVNNIGNPDGRCRYGVATRGFELKLLDEIFLYLSFEPYGRKYGTPAEDPTFYHSPSNPGAQSSYGYITLGHQEAAIWMLTAAKSKFRVGIVNALPSPVAGAAGHEHRPHQAILHLISYKTVCPYVRTAAELLGVASHSMETTLQGCRDIIRGVVKRTRVKNGHAAFVVALTLHPGITEPALEELREVIVAVRAEAERVYVHVGADSLLDVSFFAAGYNILVPSGGRYYAVDFEEQRPFHVDTVSVCSAGMTDSFKSGVLLCSTKTKRFFSSADISYINCEDSTVVGSSNGDFPLFEHYFRSRLPVPVLEEMRSITDRGDFVDFLARHRLSHYQRAVSENFLSYLAVANTNVLGYPVNRQFEDQALDPLFDLLLTNRILTSTENALVADKLCLETVVEPATAAPYVDGFAAEVIDFYLSAFFPHLANPRERYNGYVTSGGTEGNYVGFFLAAEKFRPHPTEGTNGVLFCTEEVHYSINKGAKIFGLPIEYVATLDPRIGEMDMEDLRFKVSRRRALQPQMKVVVSANMASTMKGSVDRLQGIHGVLNALSIPLADRWLHCDCACHGNDCGTDFLPFMHPPTHPEYVPVHSIAVSAHKILGSPFPCGVAIFDDTVRLTHTRVLDPLGREAPGTCHAVHTPSSYFTQHGSIVTGTQNAAMVVTVWKRLQELGVGGVKALALSMHATSDHAFDRLSKNIWCTGIRPFRIACSNIITLKPAPHPQVLARYALPDHAGWSHIVVMPSVTTADIDTFVADLIKHPITS